MNIFLILIAQQEKIDFLHKFEILNAKKGWIMTYNNCEYIRNLYKDFIIVDVSWSYGNPRPQNKVVFVFYYLIENVHNYFKHL